MKIHFKRKRIFIAREKWSAATVKVRERLVGSCRASRGWWWGRADAARRSTPDRVSYGGWKNTFFLFFPYETSSLGCTMHFSSLFRVLFWHLLGLAICGPRSGVSARAREVSYKITL